jgi:hypothetical protein
MTATISKVLTDKSARTQGQVKAVTAQALSAGKFWFSAEAE